MSEAITKEQTGKLTIKDFQSDQDVRWCPGTIHVGRHRLLPGSFLIWRNGNLETPSSTALQQQPVPP